MNIERISTKPLAITIAFMSFFLSFLAAVIQFSLEVGAIRTDIEHLQEVQVGHSLWIQDAPPDHYEEKIDRLMAIMQGNVEDLRLKGEFLQRGMSELRTEIRALHLTVEQHMDYQRRLRGEEFQ